MAKKKRGGGMAARLVRDLRGPDGAADELLRHGRGLFDARTRRSCSSSRAPCAMPSACSADLRFAGIIEQDGHPDDDPTQERLCTAPPEARPTSDRTERTTSSKEDLAGLGDRPRLRARRRLPAPSLQDMPEIAELSKNIIIEETPRRASNISLVDQDGRSMFPEGSTQPYERTRRMLEAVAPTLRRMPNRIRSRATFLARHRAAPRPAPPWELSVGRAIAVREISP